MLHTQEIWVFVSGSLFWIVQRAQKYVLKHKNTIHLWTCRAEQETQRIRNKMLSRLWIRLRCPSSCSSSLSCWMDIYSVQFTLCSVCVPVCVCVCTCQHVNTPLSSLNHIMSEINLPLNKMWFDKKKHEAPKHWHSFTASHFPFFDTHIHTHTCKHMQIHANYQNEVKRSIRWNKMSHFYSSRSQTVGEIRAVQNASDVGVCVGVCVYVHGGTAGLPVCLLVASFLFLNPCIAAPTKINK